MYFLSGESSVQHLAIKAQALPLPAITLHNTKLRTIFAKPDCRNQTHCLTSPRDLALLRADSFLSKSATEVCAKPRHQQTCFLMHFHMQEYKIEKCMAMNFTGIL